MIHYEQGDSLVNETPLSAVQRQEVKLQTVTCCRKQVQTVRAESRHVVVSSSQRLCSLSPQIK